MQKIGSLKTGEKVGTGAKKLDVIKVMEKGMSFTPFPHKLTPEAGAKVIPCELLFDDIDLNFEVGYSGNPKIDQQGWHGIPTMAKSKGEGHKLIIAPLYDNGQAQKIVADFKPEYINTYQLKFSGYLRIKLRGVSGIGEFFTYKTHSENSINIIKNQLNELAILTKGKLAGLPVELRITKKEGKRANEGSRGGFSSTDVYFLSLSFQHYKTTDGKILSGFQGLAAYVAERERMEARLDFGEYFNLISNNKRI